METITSVSGGKTSAFVAANYKADHLLFALVRTEDKNSQFPDPKIRQLVEDRIQKPFIATAEEDVIIYTMLDLEQYLGQKINWVSGESFDHVIKYKRGWLPNKLHRYCTTHLKIKPMFDWWRENIKEPVKMQIGFRANEKARAKRMNDKLNQNGLLEYHAIVGRTKTGNRNKWDYIEWQKPIFPLIENNIYKDEIESFWIDKKVRFARMNNCVHCFHRNPLLLRTQYDIFPNKMKWAENQEGGKNGYWRSDMSYKEISKHNIQLGLSFDDFSDCDSGYCGF